MASLFGASISGFEAWILGGSLGKPDIAPIEASLELIERGLGTEVLADTLAPRLKDHFLQYQCSKEAGFLDYRI